MGSAHPTLIDPELARRMFQRTLSGWAHDSLRLRAAGLDRPAARRLILPPHDQNERPRRDLSAGLAHFRPPGAQEQAA